MTDTQATSQSALTNYDAACAAVAAAASVDEVKAIRAEAEVFRAYSRQAGNFEMEVKAAEIRIRAERRLGELMAEQAKLHGLNGGGRPKTGLAANPVLSDAPATLAEAGIDKNLAHRARTYAAIPDEKFEKVLKNKRERANRQVILDPEFQAEADAAARDLEIERDERIALAGADGLVAENDKLTKQVSGLTRRISGLLEELASFKQQVKIWKERALGAGWKGRPNA